MSLNRIFLLPFALASFFAASQNPEYIRVIDSLAILGKQSEAIPYFEKELAVHGRKAPIVAELSLAYQGNRQLGEAKKFADECVKTDPSCSQCYLALGWIAIDRADVPEAIKQLTEAIRLNPQNASAYSVRGRIYGANGNDAGAFYDLNKAIELNPTRASYYYFKALYNSSKGYDILAISDLNKAIRLDPGISEYRYQRGITYAQQRDYKEALADINAAIQQDSNRTDYYNSLGGVYTDMEEWDSAFSAYSKSIEKGPDNYASYMNRSQARYKLEDIDGSCSDMYFVSSKLADGSFKNGEMSKFLSENMKNHCDSTVSSYYYQRGIALYNLKKYDRAIGIYNKGMKRFPGSAMTESFMANAYAIMENYDSSRVYYQRSVDHKDLYITELRLNVANAPATEKEIATTREGFVSTALMGIAEAEYHTGSQEKSIVIMDSAFRIIAAYTNTAPIEYYLLRANALLVLGQTEEALNVYTGSVNSVPSNPEILVNRAVARVMAADKNLRVLPGRKEQLELIFLKPLKNMKEMPASITAAISECDKAIALYPESGYTYYVRGMLKSYASLPEYCEDLKKASAKKHAVPSRQVSNCGQ